MFYCWQVLSGGYRDTKSTADLGRLIESVVYLELLRRGNKVSIGKLAEKEVDFVASNTEDITYYQASATVLDEIGAGTNYDGIKQVNLLDWLLV